MFIRNTLALMLALASFSAQAASYYIVVPVKKIAGAASAPGVASPISIALNSYTLPTGMVSVPYAGFNLNSLLTVTGDASYAGTGASWRVASGALPVGLSLSASGWITGTPTAAGTGSFTLEATYKTKSGSQTYQIVVAGMTVELGVATLPKGIAGQVYPGYDFKPLATSNAPGFDPYGATWSVASGALPPGVSLNPETGILSGTPAVSGDYSFTVRVAYLSAAGEQTYQIPVSNLIVRLASAALPVAFVGSAYQYDVSANVSVEGDPAYSGPGAVQFSVGEGVLPAGLSLSSSGFLSGTPSTSNTAGASIQVVASYKNASGQQVYTLVVNDAVLQVTGFSLGGNHSCAVTTDGAAKCWGLNSSGQLGDGSATRRATPVTVSGLSSGVKAVAAGTSHSCALLLSGEVRCWGQNTSGQLGNGQIISTNAPVQAIPGAVTEISAGGSGTCVVKNGGAYCWGYNATYRVGNGLSGNVVSTPTAVSTLSSNVAKIETALNRSCAVTTDGALYCWGTSTYGELGVLPLSAIQPTPALIVGSGVSSVSLGVNHTCYQTTGGSLRCFGLGTQGQLGDGQATNTATPVTPVNMSSGVTAFSAGGSNTCAVKTGAAYCWGKAGSIGDGALLQRNVPTAVTGLSQGVSSIDVSSQGAFSCAMTNLGAKCWGDNAYGQLGNGTQTDNLSPSTVTP